MCPVWVTLVDDSSQHLKNHPNDFGSHYVLKLFNAKYCLNVFELQHRHIVF